MPDILQQEKLPQSHMYVDIEQYLEGGFAPKRKKEKKECSALVYFLDKFLSLRTEGEKRPNRTSAVRESKECQRFNLINKINNLFKTKQV